jgi:hypothetical protein
MPIHAPQNIGSCGMEYVQETVRRTRKIGTFLNADQVGSLTESGLKVSGRR